MTSPALGEQACTRRQKTRVSKGGVRVWVPLEDKEKASRVLEELYLKKAWSPGAWRKHVMNVMHTQFKCRKKRGGPNSGTALQSSQARERLNASVAAGSQPVASNASGGAEKEPFRS